MHPRHTPRVSTLALLLLLAGAASARGATVTGTVRTEAGVGIGVVDIDFIDLCSGDNIFLSGDKSAADGSFSVVVPSGTYDIHFVPPAGSVVAAGDIQGYVVNSNSSLGIVTLHPGRLVSGTVLTPALGPAAGVDLKFVEQASDHRVFLTKTLTNASGQYSVRIPPGTWNVDYRPPASLPYTDAERTGLMVGTLDIAGLTDALGAGFNITGSARDQRGVNLKNVDIDAFDQCTGRRVATAHDNTDVNGNYSIYLPAGTYTFSFDAPACKAVESARVANLQVDRNRGFGTETLKDALPVSGIVLGSNGAPLAGAKLKFYDATAPGAPRQGATRDRTDAGGAFSVLVPAGTYDINAEPPAGVTDLVAHLNAVVVSAATDVGSISLPPGLSVSGHVTGLGGASALNVNINAVDSATRAAQRLSADGTDAAGNFNVSLAPGTYDIQYDPPACSGLAPDSQNGVIVTAATVLPSVALVAGVHATGSVFDDAKPPGPNPVPNVDLDAYPAGGAIKMYTPGDQTGTTGAYDLLIAPGTYDIRFIPPSASRLRPGLLSGVNLTLSQALPSLTLVSGWLVSGLVSAGDSGLPLQGVVLDFYAPGAGAPLWTAHHVSAVDGGYLVAVDSGTWDILYSPPAGSPYAAIWRRGVVVAGDTPLAPLALPLSLTAVEANSATGGRSSAISQPSPNPAGGAVSFTIETSGRDAEVSIYDVQGRRVATPWRGRAGSPRSIRWDGSAAGGRRLSAGVYFVRLSVRGTAPRIRRVTLLR